MKPAGADQEKRPLLQHAWKGFQKYWKIADLDLNLPTEDLLDALQLDSTILTDSSSGWLLPISKTEIESTVKGEIEKCSRNTDCVGKLPNFIFWAILFDITSVAPLMKNYLEHSRNAEHDDIDDSLARSAVFVLLNAFEYHDMDTLRLASTFVENDENDEVREKAALLLANSQNFEDMEKARKELEEYQSAYASRCMPMLYRWYATGDEIFPLLDTFFEVFYEKDYPLLARFALFTEREEIITHLLDKENEKYNKAFSLELYRNAFKNEFFHEKAQEYADTWLCSDTMGDALPFLLAYILILTESEELREKYTKTRDWFIRLGALVGTVHICSLDELQHSVKEENDKDVKEVLTFIIHIKSLEEHGSLPPRLYMDSLLQKYIAGSYSFYNPKLRELLLFSPHIAALQELPSYKDFHMLISDSSYAQKIDYFTKRPDLLFLLKENGRSFALFHTSSTLTKSPEEEAAVIAHGIDSEGMRDLFEMNFIQNIGYYESHASLMAIKNTGEVRSRFAQMKERRHTYGARGLNGQEYRRLEHLMYRETSIDMVSDYLALFLNDVAWRVAEQPEQLLILLHERSAKEEILGSVDEFIDKAKLYAIPPCDIPVIEDLRKLLSGQVKSSRELRSYHMFPKLLGISERIAQGFQRLFSPAELYENPHFYHVFTTNGSSDARIFTMLTHFYEVDDTSSLFFFLDVFSEHEEWRARQQVVDLCASEPRTEYIPIIRKLIDDEDDKLRNSAVEVFKMLEEL